jgi:N-acetyl sugar amidotransferase
MQQNVNNLKICTRCIYDEKVPGISFNQEGVCNYCTQIDEIAKIYKTGTPEGEETLMRIIEEIKKAGKNKKYDCVIGVSGGTDSSFLLAKAVEWGLNPLAVHYDNTWNTAISTENIRKVTSKLKVDLYTLVVDNKEADDLVRSFFLSGSSDLDAPTDLALAETMYRAASQYKIKYLLEGHSFLAEGISPLSNSYVDGRYIELIHRTYGKIKMKTFPNMKFLTFLKWTIFKRIKKIRPLWYINYSKEAARKYLESEFGWQDYGGHHLENRISAFSHSYFLPTRFGIDQRNNSISASVRNGVIKRDEGIFQYYQTKPHLEPELVEYFKKRLQLSEIEFSAAMNAPFKSYKDFKTYKKLFEVFRPIFYSLAKSNLVPMSFYLKYCLPEKSNSQ